ncbi:MAG TPA: PKD domain-containing protein [Flavisolibacter sp.]|jgi:gliding motility-associated-like protein|nr:PKD domain-containing protein [Flavisolibacter sp.]
MKNSLTLIAILMVLVGKAQSFHFTSDGIKRQSAGVFDENGRLIRTLFSGKVFPASNYTYDWDGLDDEGKIVPKGSYNVKILSNNIQYHWEGIIGNTSDSVSGPTKWRGYGLSNGMVTVGDYVYVAQGYGEFMPSGFRFHISAPNTRLTAIANNATTQKTGLAVCSDSNYIYWAEWSLSAKNRKLHAWVVHATKVSDNSQVTFPNGTNYAFYYGKPRSVIGLQDQATDPQTAAAPTALAVQRKGQYLFVSRKTGNRIDVYNKKTGAFVRSLAFQKPTGMSMDKNDNIWVVTEDKVVSKYVINTDGRLAKPTIVIKDLSQPQNVCVSPDGSYILIADCGTSQQLKAFSSTTGKSLWVLGQEGGYINSTEVTNTRFMFSDINGVDFKKFQIPSITFQSDGSFWFSDNGNRRILHFDVNRKYLDQISFLGPTYEINLVAGDPTRLINNHFEFFIDYSKPFKESWTLKRNYAYRVDASKYDHHHHGLAHPVKYPNGRTYALYRRKGYGNINNTWEIVELREDGLRMTGVIVNDVGITLFAQDGSIVQQSGRDYGKSTIIRRKVLLGFDGLGNPKYSDFSTYLETPALSINSPVHWGVLPPAITENGYYWFFDPKPKLEAGGYHFGAVPIGGKTWHVLTSKGTGKNYRGDFPSDGRFDDGNGVNSYAGSLATAVGKHVVWGYHGEFWRNTQVNKYNHYFENGLFIGQFGVTGDEPSVRGIEAAPQMAGNALLPVLVKGPDGNLYLYHGDETHHGGIHRWKVTGLETIEENIIPLDEKKMLSFNASFSADKKTGCLPLEVNFTDGSDTTAGAITQWFWDFGDGSTSTESNPSHIYTKPGTYKVSLVVTNASGCSKNFSRTNYIEVYEKPSIAIINDTTSCLGSGVSFKSTMEADDAARFDWKWNFGNGETDTTQSPEPQIYDAAGTYAVTLTLTDGFGCSAQAESRVTVQTSPVVDAGPDSEICLGSSQQLKATGAIKYSWDAASSLNCADCETPLATPSDWTQYKVTGYNEAGCSSSDWVTVNVRKPFALEIDGKEDICIGESVELTASGADQYSWLLFPGQSDATASIIEATPQVSTTYTVVAKDDAGCFTDTASLVVNVHSLPVVSAGADVAICRGSAERLQASGASNYTWSTSQALSCTDCASPMAAPSATTEFVVTGFDAYGCSASDAVQVTVHQPFKVRINPVPDICIGRSATLAASGADQYNWSPSVSVANPSSATTTVTPQTSTQYTVVGKDNAGCFTDTASVAVTVWPYPTVEAGETQILSVGNVLKLSPTYSADVTSYLWNHPQTLSCSNCAFPEAKPKSETTYRVEVANRGGCRTSDELTVRVICNNGNLFIPNTFSPNQDGRNDRFFPRGTGIDRVKSFKIYNRWGELVYSNENFQANEPSSGWDGRFKGQVLPSDVFVYSCEVVCTNNELLTFKGDVTLLR